MGKKSNGDDLMTILGPYMVMTCGYAVKGNPERPSKQIRSTKRQPGGSSTSCDTTRAPTRYYRFSRPSTHDVQLTHRFACTVRQSGVFLTDREHESCSRAYEPLLGTTYLLADPFPAIGAFDGILDDGVAGEILRKAGQAIQSNADAEEVYDAANEDATRDGE